MKSSPPRPDDEVRAELILERQELEEKRVRLSTFIETRVFRTLPPAQRVAMKRQAVGMTEYSNALQIRIELLEQAEK